MVVELVNSRLGNKLPINELLAGSVDPDQAVYDSYTGIESKHHHDEGRDSSGRPHTRDDIQRIVYFRCLLARKHWLADDSQNAAFQFGVATHFYMDGFISSPSVNEVEHRKGDAQFAKAVRDVDELHVMALAEYDVHFVSGQIRKLSNSFGTNDTRIVKDAIEVLAAIGRAVMTAKIPIDFPEKLQQISSNFSGLVREQERNFRNQLLGEKACNNLLGSAAQRAAEGLFQSRFMLRCLVAAHLFDSGNSGFMFPVVALVMRYRFRRYVASKASHVLQAKLRAYVGDLHSAYSQSRNVISRLSTDTEWYCTNTIAHLKTLSLNEVRGSYDVYHSKLLRFNKAIQQKAESRVAVLEHESVASVQESGRDLWEDTFCGWIGRECIELPALKYLWSGLPLFIILVLAASTALSSHGPSWFGVAIMSAVSMLLTACVWIVISTCQAIRREFQQLIVFTCPRCQSSVERWRLKCERIVVCPDCQQKINLVRRGPR